MARLSEFTFTAFTTHRVLDDLRQQYQSEPYAVAPTQFDERNLGYDARIQTQKILYFQYKRASAHRRYWSYPIRTNQLYALRATSGGAGRAYYVLPRIWNEADLRNALPPPYDSYFDRISFIDALQIPIGTTRIVLRNGAWTAHGLNFSSGLTPTDWNQILRGILECTAGLLLWRRIEDGEIDWTNDGRAFLERKSTLKELSDELSRFRERPSDSQRRSRSHDLATRLIAEIPEIGGDEADIRLRESAIEALRRAVLREVSSRRYTDLSVWGLGRAQLFSIFQP